jgi:lipopolysaccharide biosynthesis regulator YciM
MEFEYWMLLGFPLFFGWATSRRVDIRYLVRDSRQLNSTGLNFCPTSSPDKAIEVFMRWLPTETW